MVLTAACRGWAIAMAMPLCAALAVAAPPATPAGAEPPAPGAAWPADWKGEVSLSLHDYLELEQSAELADQARARDKDHQEPRLAEVVAQRSRLDYDGPAAPPAPAAPTPPGAGAVRAAAPAAGAGEAWLDSELEVVVQGKPLAPVSLPVAGTVVSAEVRGDAGRAAAVLDGSGAVGAGLVLVAVVPGRYTVHVRCKVVAASDGGVIRLALPRTHAQVAVVDVNLPSALAWESPGAVVAEDRVQGDRRLLRLSAARGAEPRLEIRRTVAGSEAAQLLVQDVVTTFLQVRPEGTWRHDVVLYDVARGELGEFAVDLPAGLTVERAGTDEGAADPIVTGNRLVVHRQRRLHGTGYLVLTSRPAAPGGAVPLGAVEVAPAPRARYLAVAAGVAGQTQPLPAAAWTRVDLDDLPVEMRGALAALDAVAAWRLAAAAPAGGALALQVTPAARAALLATLVRRRVTTTLLTVDGTLLHRDRFELGQAGDTLDLTLPAGATLWSASVDGVAVRPLTRDATGRSLTVPLGGGAAKVVEVVAVAAGAIAPGRSQLDLELAQVQAPVVEHRWQVLLPENASYRFRGGDLRPVVPTFRGGAARNEPVEGGMPAPPPIAAAAPKAVDRLNVGGNEAGQNALYVKPGAIIAAAELAEVPVLDARQAPKVLDELRQGLVGGVRPLPVTIPQTGKGLVLAGLLPPPAVHLQLETRAARR